jgi:nitroimidazol reductase NimA-like FMN-containing flavoprotein (pyridoxamine 5'-phosphate oxidase superfamily)
MPRPNKEAAAIIDSIKYITVATVDDKGQPWNTPVAGFHFDKDYTLYWASYAENQHSKNIRGNGKVFIVIYDSTPSDEPEVGVYIKAVATELVDTDEIMKAALVFKDDLYNPADGKKYMGEYPRRIYKAVPERFWTNSDSIRNGSFVDVRELAQIKGGLTPEGAKKALETKRKKYGDDFFKSNGQKGGQARNLSPNEYNSKTLD